jgi:uncharacterized protein with HEPN domain
MTISCSEHGRGVGFRNPIFHEYAEIDPHIVWAIVQNEVPTLLEKSESLLEELRYGV